MLKDALKRMMAASVRSNRVFSRFAQLSDEEKQQVVDKVKEKVKGKGTEEPEDTDQEEPIAEESTVDESTVDDSAGEDNSHVIKEEDRQKIIDLAENPGGDADESEESDGDADIEFQSPAADEPEEFESVDAPDAESDESESADGTESAPTPDDDTNADQSDDDKPSSDLSGIVDDIAQEIQQIKSDGKVTPNEVMGLMDNMMTMVNQLLRAKPGRVRKAMLTRREAVLAERLARESLISKQVSGGYSYALDRLTLDVKGWQPINVDVLRAIDQTWFPALDDMGGYIEGRMDSVRYERVEPRGPLTYSQEQLMKRLRKAPIQRLIGVIPQGSMRDAVMIIGKMLKRKFDLKIVDYGVHRA
jgi:hypothetical protein